MNSAVFLQARLGSSRLPHKILLTLDGMTVLEQAMKRLSLVNTDQHVVLTDSLSFDLIQKIAFTAGWECFEGPGDDVLARYVFAARHYAVDTIVRATADNPLVNFELANMLLTAQEEEAMDYRAHLGMPYGAGVELVRSEALEIALRESGDSFDREHVSPYLYKNPTRFSIKREYAPEEFLNPDLRITLDNEEDYRFLVSLYRSYDLSNTLNLPPILKNMYPVAV